MKTYLAPVSLARGAGRCHLCFLLAFLQLLSSQDDLTRIIPTLGAVPAHNRKSIRILMLMNTPSALTCITDTLALLLQLELNSAYLISLVRDAPHQSSSVGMMVRGGLRQYVWKAMSHSSHSSCLSGSCFTPHIRQLHQRQVFLGSSLQCLHSGPLDPKHAHKYIKFMFTYISICGLISRNSSYNITFECTF